MDDNTFKLALAIVSSIQVVALAALAIQQSRSSGKIDTVHQLVNGMQHEKESAIAAAATFQGELAGRDFERGRGVDAGPQQH